MEFHQAPTIANLYKDCWVTNKSDFSKRYLYSPIMDEDKHNIIRRPSRLSGSSKFMEGSLDRRRTTCTLPLTFSRQASVSYSNVQSQWEILMRKFSQDCKRNHTCHVQSDLMDGVTCEPRPEKKFSTGSSYDGTWDAIGICGYGIYTFPNGVIYEGEFEDNVFHGDGEMRYPDGTRLRGKWNYGELIDRTIVFDDGVHYKENNWTYCKPSDRRYSCEFTEGIQPGGISYITKDRVMKDIPDGTYDVGDGFYDPATGNIIDYDDSSRIVRVAVNNLRPWIEENCRKCPDVPLGPQPELYKHWVDPSLQAAQASPPACLSDDNDIINSFETSILSGQTGPYGSVRIRCVPESFQPDSVNLVSEFLKTATGTNVLTWLPKHEIILLVRHSGRIDVIFMQITHIPVIMEQEVEVRPTVARGLLQARSTAILKVFNVFASLATRQAKRETRRKGYEV